MRRVRRAGAALLGVVVALALPARPAAADPARPGNVISTVLDTAPANAPITAKVVGGDAFLELTVARGHEVVVLDYDTPPHPYLRFAADGTVAENVNSKAYYQNRTRYSTDSPENLASEPSWRVVASGGTYAWHDHRVHFMARTRPPRTPWTVPLTLDGAPASVDGAYGPVSAPSPLPWLALAVAGCAAVVLVTRRVRRAGAIAALGSAAVAFPIVVALGRLPSAGGVVRTGGLVVAAAVAAVCALVMRSRAVAGALAAGAGSALVLWAVRRTSVLSHAVLVTSAPAALDRVAVALCLGVGVAAVITGVRAVVAPAIDDAARHVVSMAKSA